MQAEFEEQKKNHLMQICVEKKAKLTRMLQHVESHFQRIEVIQTTVLEVTEYPLLHWLFDCDADLTKLLVQRIREVPWHLLNDINFSGQIELVCGLMSMCLDPNVEE